MHRVLQRANASVVEAKSLRAWLVLPLALLLAMQLLFCRHVRNGQRRLDERRDALSHRRSHGECGIAPLPPRLLRDSPRSVVDPSLRNHRGVLVGALEALTLVRNAAPARAEPRPETAEVSVDGVCLDLIDLVESELERLRDEAEKLGRRDLLCVALCCVCVCCVMLYCEFRAL